MSILKIDVKPLQPSHMRDAKLFSDRYELMKHIAGLMANDGVVNPNIAEIGVALGDFSQFLIETFAPATFAAIDLFELHLSETIWGMPTKQMFEGMTQSEFYRKRLARTYNGRLIVEEGMSAEATSRLEDESYHLIYIDAGHDYESVMKDALVALKKIKTGGYIVFNDYTMMDHLYGTPYGVVPVANELIVDSGRMAVIGFGLNPQMFCDLAVKIV